MRLAAPTQHSDVPRFCVAPDAQELGFFEQWTERAAGRYAQSQKILGETVRNLFRAICIATATQGAVQSAVAQETITLTIRDVLERPALYFPAPSNQATVLVHQSGWSADSWAPLAKRLQHQNISSVSLMFASSEDVLAAVQYLHDAGSEEITLIGASIGGGASMQALRRNSEDVIDNIILLGTSEGDTSEATATPKLFVVSEHDFFAGRTHASYAKASEPKRLIVYPGSAHGQEMLDSPYAEQLIAEILAVIRH